MGDMFLMMQNGMFIVNGIECVVVLQMYCLLGVFFDYDCGKMYFLGKLLFVCCIIFYCGSWLDFEFDVKDLVFVCIDCCCKLLVMMLFYVFGMDQEGIMDVFYDIVDYKLWCVGKGQDVGWIIKFFFECVCGICLIYDLVNVEIGEVIIKVGEKVILCLVK